MAHFPKAPHKPRGKIVGTAHARSAAWRRRADGRQGFFAARRDLRTKRVASRTFVRLVIPTNSPTVPSPGQLVSVRQRRYVVTQVVPSALPARPLAQAASPSAPQHLLHLQSIDDDGLGEELSVVWELEPGTRTFERTVLPSPQNGFDDPARLEAFLDAVRWGAVASADVGAIHAPFRSGIAIEDYQLDPLVRAIEMPRVNLLIADDVGLGKTIEAGLVAQELLLRYRARSVLIVCPAGLQLQWRDQMRDKFGLEFRIIDSEALRELRRRRGLHVNPWTYFPRLITSIDFLKRDRPMRMMRDALPGPGEARYPRRFDLLILDEAHNAAPSGRGKLAIESLRTDCIRELVPHFEHKLFLTATPHNGYTESFSALLELLDDQRFQRTLEPDRVQLERVMVRRLKRDLPKDDLGRDRFPKRSLEAIEIAFPEEERRAHSLLNQYAELRAKSGDDGEAGDAGKGEESSSRYATNFLMKLLKKRLFSSPEAFRLTLETHLKNVARGSREKTAPATRVRPGILRREIARAAEDTDSDEVYEEEERALVGMTSQALRPLSPEETKITKELLSWAEKASARLDAKGEAFFTWLEEIVRPKGKWGDTRVIVFTEYRATQKWLADKLATRGLTQDGRLLTLYGGMIPEEREKIKHAFQAAPDLSKVRVLLATDAASEGIDLQNHCSRLLHYEIPWNPNRMEQRNGRVDRHGQKSDPVRVFHFVGKGFHEKRISKEAEPGSLEGDLEFLFLAAKKVDQIREDLGSAGDVLATQVEEAMLGKRKKLDTESVKPRSSAAKKALLFERNLEARLADLVSKLKSSRDELHISPASLEAAVSVALSLAGHPPLAPVTIPRRAGSEPSDPPVKAFRVPMLAGSWASCLDGLPHPHTGELRPITFDHEIARDRDDVVLAHLGHRLVSMCVGLLRAEVWAPEEQRKLSRVSARVSAKLDKPLLVAYARLVMLGADNSRLHEELLKVGGTLDRGRLVPLPADELARLLESASREAPRGVPKATQADLLKLWPDHEKSLDTALASRAKERERSVKADLEVRRDKEMSDHTVVLQELEKALRLELNPKSKKQRSQLDMFGERPSSPSLDGSDDAETEAHHQAMQARVDAIKAEIPRETAAIAARYHEPTARVFPVAVTYFLPSNMVAHAGGSR